MEPRYSNPMWQAITKSANRLRRSPHDHVMLTDVAADLKRDHAEIQRLAMEMDDLRMIRTDGDTGRLPTRIEGKA